MVALKQPSFAGGLLSSQFLGRSDQTKYQTGLRECRNFIVTRFGSIENRPGTIQCGEVKDSSQKVRLVKFVFNDNPLWNSKRECWQTAYDDKDPSRSLPPALTKALYNREYVNYKRVLAAAKRLIVKYLSDTKQYRVTFEPCHDRRRMPYEGD